MKATNCSLWRSDKFFPSLLNQRTRLLLLLAFLGKWLKFDYIKHKVFFIRKEKKGQHDDAYMYYATFEAQFMKNLNNTEAELKNSVFFFKKNM